MFGRMIGQMIRISARNREVIIWTMLFPILMSTLFYFAFGSLDQTDMLEPIPVAVVEDEEYGQALGFAQLIDSLSGGEDPLLSRQACGDEKQARRLLEEGAVDGVIQIRQDTPKLVVKEDGLNQTILRQALTQYAQTAYSLREASEPAVLDTQRLTQAVSLTNNPPSDKVIYFYALLAMVCLFGSFQGIIGIHNLQANQSALGARRNMAPLPYSQTLLASILGGTLLHGAIVLLSLAYMALVLKISFGGRIWLAALGCLTGSLTGVSLGTLLGSAPKLGFSAKIGLSVGVSLLLCFCSGLMFSGINYWIHVNLPALSWLNPAARLTDALYSLYYYDTLQPFFMNLGILLLFAAALFTASAVVIRRYRYESV